MKTNDPFDSLDLPRISKPRFMRSSVQGLRDGQLVGVQSVLCDSEFVEPPLVGLQVFIGTETSRNDVVKVLSKLSECFDQLIEQANAHFAAKSEKANRAFEEIDILATSLPWKMRHEFLEKLGDMPIDISDCHGGHEDDLHF